MFKSTSQTPFLNFVAVLIFLMILISALQAGKALLIPFVLAIVFWYIVITLTQVYEDLKWTKIKIPHLVAQGLAIATCVLVIWILVIIVNSNVKYLIELIPAYQEKIRIILARFSSAWGIEKLDLPSLVNEIDLRAFFSGLANGIGTLLSLSGTVLVYLIFLLLEYRQFKKKIKYLFPNKKQREHFQKVITRINENAQTYFKIQSLISFATGFLVYLILLGFGIEFAAFWGILTFILNFIPVIGSVIATLLPLTFALVQIASFPIVIAIGILLSIVQITLGNIMLPRLMGKSLNLTPLIILLSLAFWGMVWGIPGMFLAVPIMVILNIILAQFKSTRWIAILFSGTGKV